MNRRMFFSFVGMGWFSLNCAEKTNLITDFDDWKKLSQNKRFEKLYQDDYSFKFEMPQNGVQTATISTQNIGDLILTSGKIIAWDPLMGPDLRYYLTKQTIAGNYPVVLSLAEISPFGDFRIAAAKVVFTNEPTVKWAVAEINEMKLVPRANHNYPVDSGTGSFMDYDTAKPITKLSFEDFEDKFCKKVISAMEKNEVGKYKAAGWANISVVEKTRANLVAFHSGWGDGSYISYWGYDKNGANTSLLTDFELFYTEEN